MTFTRGFLVPLVFTASFVIVVYLSVLSVLYSDICRGGNQKKKRNCNLQKLNT